MASFLIDCAVDCCNCSMLAEATNAPMNSDEQTTVCLLTSVCCSPFPFFHHVCHAVMSCCHVCLSVCLSILQGVLLCLSILQAVLVQLPTIKIRTTSTLQQSVLQTPNRSITNSTSLTLPRSKQQQSRCLLPLLQPTSTPGHPASKLQY